MSRSLFLVGSLSSSVEPLPLDAEGAALQIDRMETLAVAVAGLIERVAELEDAEQEDEYDPDFWKKGKVEPTDDVD